MTARYPTTQIIFGWCVHLITSVAAALGLFALIALSNHDFKTAFLLMGFSVFIDAIDGTLARLTKVRLTIPFIDGTLLDNMVDFITYVIVPCYFLMVSNIMPQGSTYFIVFFVIIASCYQFTHTDAKTKDYFFKGFPCYWNFVFFYFHVFNSPTWFNLSMTILFIVLVFLPVKAIYPSRMQYISKYKSVRIGFLSLSIIFGAVSVVILVMYPKTNEYLLGFTLFYIVIYTVFSLYRTFVPLKIDKSN